LHFYEEDVRRDISSIGHAMKELVEVVWRTGGQQRALEVIRETNKTGHSMGLVKCAGYQYICFISPK
jgi:hypothetical protein